MIFAVTSRSESDAPSAIAVAILNARPTTLGLAVLDAQLTQQDDGWYQLLPVGPFKARDGRPFDVPGGHWQLDKGIATTLINRAKALGQDILIDYDHQTLNVEKTGKEAPAAGWYNGDEIEWREGLGLFIRPRWTERAAAMIAAKEYRFLSAVFPYDAQGRPLELRMTAITNDPGVVGMQALAALSAQPIQPGQPATLTKENSMNELLKKLLAKLGIELTGDPTDEQLQKALTELDSLQASAKKAPELEAALSAEKASLAALKAQPGGQVDLAQFVPVATYNALVTQVAALTAQVDTTDAATLIKEARAAGKVVAAEEEYLTAYAAQKGWPPSRRCWSRAQPSPRSRRARPLPSPCLRRRGRPCSRPRTSTPPTSSASATRILPRPKPKQTPPEPREGSSV